MSTVLQPEPKSFAVLDGDSNTFDKNTAFKDQEKVRKEGFSLDETEFITTLDAKLKSLEEEGRKRKNGKKRSSSLDNRPMFITTVKTGIFLDPPPELAALLGYSRSSYNVSSGSTASQKSSEELMYSFSSHPRVLNNNHHGGRLKTKVNNDRLQQVNLEKQKNKNNNLRTKRDVANHSNNLNSSMNNNNHQNNSLNNSNNNKREDIHYGNIMHDRRVVRGPAFLQNPVPTEAAESPAARQAEARRRMMARRRAQSQKVRALRYRLGTPPQVEGRKSQSLQTHEYLEELYDAPPRSVETQTICEADRPPTPVFERLSPGVEVGTQILPGELFHFDTEVTPILDVLVGKTIEQSLTEVFEEDELAALRQHQRLLRETRDTEVAEEQRLQAAESRRQEQLESRLIEEELAAAKQVETEDRVAAAVLSTGYIVDLLPSVVQGLKDAGYLYEEIKDEMGDDFMDWLIKEVKTEMQRMVENRDLLTEMLREILGTRAELYRALGEKAAKKRGAEDEDELTPTEVTVSTAATQEEESAGEEARAEEQMELLPAEQ